MKKPVLILILFIGIIYMASLSSCSKSGGGSTPPPPPPPPPPTCNLTGTAGPLFSAVKTLMQNNCVSCHNATTANGGMNWTVDCNIIDNKTRIKARAVDGNPSFMPTTGPLPQSERDKISAWINAGGKYTD